MALILPRERARCQLRPGGMPDRAATSWFRYRCRALKRLTVRILAALGAFVLAVLLIELWARTADPFGISYWSDFSKYQGRAIEPALEHGENGRIFAQRPALELELATFDLFTDDHGLRAAGPDTRVLPRSGPREPGEPLRLMFLGDSVTLGWGVDDEDTWVRFVERTARAADGAELECLNGGHMVYDTVQEAALLQELGPLLRPDVVVVMFISNDVISTWENFFGGLPPEEGGRPAPDARWKRQLGETFPGIRGLLRYRRLASDLDRVERRELLIPPQYPAEWPRCETALDAMLATSRSIGARLVVLDHTKPRYPEVRAWSERNGVPCIDTMFTDDEWRQDVRNSAVDAHANTLGNRMIGEKVVAGLRAAGILE